MTTTITARAALLDMDGTLVDSTAVVEKLWWGWAQSHDLSRERVLEVVHGRQGWQSMAILLPERDPAINLAENAVMLARESVELDGVVEIPGADAFLRSLQGLPHAIVTSANVELMTARMSTAGLTMPAVRITAESCSQSKPHPEGFLLGASTLAIGAADCVVFEDSEAGIQAGLAAGMRVIGVGAHAAKFSPTHHVNDLTEVAVRATTDGFSLTF